MPNIKVEQSHYPDGKLRWEGSFENDKLAGPNRHWHENGVMSEECLFEAGLQHGVARQWNKEGRLLGEFRMDHGTGIEKSWYENGQLERESSSVNGKLCGRLRCWFEDGDLMGSEF